MLLHFHKDNDFSCLSDISLVTELILRHDIAYCVGSAVKLHSINLSFSRVHGVLEKSKLYALRFITITVLLLFRWKILVVFGVINIRIPITRLS